MALVSFNRYMHLSVAACLLTNAACMLLIWIVDDNEGTGDYVFLFRNLGILSPPAERHS